MSYHISIPRKVLNQKVEYETEPQREVEEMHFLIHKRGRPSNVSHIFPHMDSVVPYMVIHSPYMEVYGKAFGWLSYGEYFK